MIAVIAPTRWEFNSTLRAIPRLSKVEISRQPARQLGDTIVFRSGIGSKRLQGLLSDLERRQPKQIWLLGCCGGISTDLKCGDIVLATCTIGYDGNVSQHVPSPDLQFDLDRIAAANSSTLHIGSIRSVNEPMELPEKKKALAPAIGVEMEAGTVAPWARDKGIRFVHVRTVLDPVDSLLPRLSFRQMWRVRQQLGAIHSFRKQMAKFDVTNQAICRMLKDRGHLFQPIVGGQ